MNKMYNDYAKFAKSNCGVSSSVLDGYARHQDLYLNPTIIEERKLNVAQMDVFSRLMMDRILWLNTEVDADVMNILNSQMLYLDSISDDDISLYINSPGGSVVAGLSTYDIMNYINSDVATYCMGMSASMGAVLLSSGTKGKRMALPHSDIMIHQPLTSTGLVQASDMEIQWKEMKKCKTTLYNILSENTGKTFDEIEAACDRDNWFTASEAVDFGLIDKVIKKNVR
jgi:ATP-dependent Clp protease protease subunit